MTKTIRYNRDSRDFDMYLDGEYVGSRATHGEAEPALDAIASAQLADAAAAETDLSVPAAAEILAVVKDRHDAARQAEDFAGARQLDRVRANVARGARLTWSYGDLLIQSVNTPGAVYSVNRSGCTCPNGAAGRSACWHLQLHDLLLEMRDDAAATADIAAAAAAEREAAAAALKRRIAAARCARYSRAA